MNMDAIIDHINQPNYIEGDYIQDGLLYCGKCHTRKQTHGEGCLSGRILSVVCHCRNDELEREHEQQRLQRIEERRERCLPRDKMRNSTFAASDSSKAIEVARKYVTNWEQLKKRGAGLVFYGNVGTGKSFAALCIANALIDEEIPVRYITAADMLGTFTSKETNQKEYLDSICSAPLLIVDDLGAEHGSDYAQAQICRIIDARRDSGKPIIVTTNYTLQEMLEPDGQHRQRMFDRLLASCVPVLVEGTSRRKKEGADLLDEARKLLS